MQNSISELITNQTRLKDWGTVDQFDDLENATHPVGILLRLADSACSYSFEVRAYLASYAAIRIGEFLSPITGKSELIHARELLRDHGWADFVKICDHSPAFALVIISKGRASLVEDPELEPDIPQLPLAHSPEGAVA